MSSIDDHDNAAEQTRYHRNSVQERGRAVLLVCSYAQDADDARRLFRLLGLDPRDGRIDDNTSPTPGPSSVLTTLPDNRLIAPQS